MKSRSSKFAVVTLPAASGSEKRIRTVRRPRPDSAPAAGDICSMAGATVSGNTSKARTLDRPWLAPVSVART